MHDETRLASTKDAAAIKTLIGAVTADLQATGKQEFLYIQPPEYWAQAVAEGRVVVKFIDNALVGAVIFQQGDIATILQNRFPDVTDIPDNLGDGVYASNGMVLPSARGQRVMGDMLMFIADLHPDQRVFSTIHHKNDQQIKARERIGSSCVATLHSPERPSMLLYAQPATAQPVAAVA